MRVSLKSIHAAIFKRHHCCCILLTFIYLAVIKVTLLKTVYLHCNRSQLMATLEHGIAFIINSSFLQLARVKPSLQNYSFGQNVYTTPSENNMTSLPQRL